MQVVDVLPTPEISDHDSVYACINARMKSFEPRHKFIRMMNRFNINSFIQDVSFLPFCAVFALDNCIDQLDVFNELILSCIDKHAPLKKVRLTRPPAPWMRDLDISKLQNECRSKRFLAHNENNETNWISFRTARNALKAKIKSAKNIFYKTALSSKKPKEVWKFIHRILNPAKSKIDFDTQKLNTHYISTATRLLDSDRYSLEDLNNFIKDLPVVNSPNQFIVSKVSYEQVLSELKSIRSDCSSGYDNISMTFLKPIIDYIASPLTYIINSAIDELIFPEQWKIAKVTPIPKKDQPTKCDDFRPISVLPILSKVYERLLCRQIFNYIEKEYVLKPTMSGFRKLHSTTTLLLKIRDDIMKGMEKGEVTLALFCDYSKAFDTVSYKTILDKMHHIGFSKASLELILSYISNRKQYVQINELRSSTETVMFGVPQGSILGPIFFNIYVNDLQDKVDGTICQYADDTTFYQNCKVKDISSTATQIENRLQQLQNWSNNNNLVFNPSKTKSMLFSSKQLSKYHELHKDEIYQIKFNKKLVERESCIKLLGINFDEHLEWDIHFSKLLKSSYQKLYQLKKLKRFTPFNVRRNLAVSLLLSKLDYCNVLFFNAPKCRLRRLQKLLNSIASFVVGRYSTSTDVINLKWLPIDERIDFNIIKLAHKAIHQENFPFYLKLGFNTNIRSNRIDNQNTLRVPVTQKTFEGKASRIFNDLPSNIRREVNYETFCKLAKTYLLDKALAANI